MKETLNVGIIGLGGRGYGTLETITPMKDIRVLAVCDLYEDRREAGRAHVEKAQGINPLSTADYREILKMEEIDAVLVTTSWTDHISISVDAMKAGKYVACEVGGAYSVDDCWRLVRTYEETGTPCMLLENCCYNREELMVLNMVKQGLFGEIVHCEGGYRHDLRDEVAFGRENRHYRLENYKNRCCENYPTHELGPIAKILNINRGNRMVTLNAVASKAAGLNAFLMKEKGPDYDLTGYPFAQGDVVTTIIRCAHGETITLTLDTTLPRPYSRGFHIQGTKGMFEESNMSVFIDGVHNKDDFYWERQWGNVKEYYEKYEHPLWKWYTENGVTGGHGGMDGLLLRAFFESAKKGIGVPIDVYDMASWMSISALSEASIQAGGAPVAIPDFTCGKWLNREAPVDTFFTLDSVRDDYDKLW